MARELKVAPEFNPTRVLDAAIQSSFQSFPEAKLRS
jgi:hypothetical protein